MDTRRSFIKKAGGGTALSLLSLSPWMADASGLATHTMEEKPLVLGVIGAENSHTEGMGKLFNVEKKFPGVELRYVWGETEEFAKRAMERGKIPNIVKDPREMLGKIDAVIVDHRHPKFHLEAVRPFVEAGIPAFVDKPFCYRVAEGKEFLAMARAKGTPVTSFSSIAQSAATFDMKEQVSQLGDISNVVCYGPADFDSPYGGIFFYGVHLVEPMMYMFGEEVERLKVTRNGKHGSAAVQYRSGLLVTLVIKSLSSGWDTFVETKKGVIKLASRVPEPDPGKNYADMVEMFRTRKEPRTHESILKGIAILEALEQSAQTELWTEVKSC